MRFLLTSAIKDLRRRLRDPVALSIWIGLPLLLGFLIGLVAGGRGDDVPTARVLLVNEDDSPFTDMLVGALTQSGMSDRVAIEFEAVDRATGEERIGNGNGTALLVLPAGFAAALTEARPTTLLLVTNPAETILPAIVVEGLEIVREGAFYAERLLGEPLRAIAAGPADGGDFFDSAAVAVIAAEINDRILAARRRLDPPLLELGIGDGADDGTADEPGGGGANGSAGVSFDLASFLLPGMILMSILFIAQGMSDDVWTEKESGTLRRAVWAPRPLLVFIAGKLVAGILLISLVSSIALTAASFWFDLEIARVPAAVVWCAFAGAGLFGLFLLISMLATSHRTANLLTSMLLFPLLIVGGSFFPLEALPAWMARFGAWTPNGIALTQLADLMTGTPDAGSLAFAALLIAAFGGLALGLSVLRARRFVTA